MEHDEFTIGQYAVDVAPNAQTYALNDTAVEVTFGGQSYRVELRKVSVDGRHAWAVERYTPIDSTGPA